MTARRVATSRLPVRVRAQTGTHGFTLIEAVVVIAVMSLLGAGLAGYMADSADAYISASRENELGVGTWTALERISVELRETAFLNGGVEPVISPKRGKRATAITFTRPYAEQSRCPACMDNSTTVTFSYTPENFTLWRSGYDTGQRPLAGKVTAFTVTASDDPAPYRVYEITITRRADPADKTSREVTMTTTVYPPASRNSGWTEVIR